MKIYMRVLLFVSWIALAFASSVLLAELRKIGTTWINNPGFLRVIALCALVVGGILAPLMLAVMAWFGQPSGMYKKVTSQRAL